MPNYKVTKKALADLIETGRYTTKEWGVTQRNTYLKEIDHCFTQISENPEMGIACDYISNDYRKFPHGIHLIFYKINNESVIEIIRVLHKSVDVVNKLE